MTIEIYDDVPDEARRSNLFTAAVVGGSGPLFVQMYDAPSGINITVDWPTRANMSAHWVTYGANQATTLTIEAVDSGHPITAVTVRPEEKAIVSSVVSGVATIEVPRRTALHVRIVTDNGPEVFIINSRELEAINASVLISGVDPVYGDPIVTYSAQTEADSDETLYFPPGVHAIGIRFPIRERGRVYLAGGAWLVGTFDVRAGVGIRIDGPGTLSGEFTDWLTLISSGTYADDWFPTAMVFGYRTTPPFICTDGVISNITIVASPFYNVTGGVNIARDLTIINVWNVNSDGCNVYGDTSDEGQCLVEGCLFMVSDDVTYVDGLDSITMTDNYLISCASGACIIFSYRGHPANSYTQTITDNYARLVGFGATIEGFDDPGSHAVLKAWQTSYPGTADVVSSVTIDGLWIDGPCHGKLMSFQNRLLPEEWGFDTGAALGSTYDFTITNVHMTHRPVIDSIFEGVDELNAPRDFDFSNMSIAGVRITARNWHEYVDVQEPVYNIRFGGKVIDNL